MTGGRPASSPGRRRIGPIRHRRTFDHLRRTSRRGRSGPVSARFVPENSWSKSEIAYVIGRPVGSAVVRNRLRRRLRAIVAGLDPSLAPGAYLLRAEPGATELDFGQLTTAVERALDSARADRTGPAAPHADVPAGSRR